MAFTAPTKSQPLHNFNLPHLSWNKDGTANHHNRPSRRPNSSDYSVKKSPIRGESSSSRSIDVRERERAPIGGDSVRRRDLELKEDRVRSRGGSGVLIECDSRSSSRFVEFGGLRNESVDSMRSLGRGGDTEKFVRRSEIGGDSVRRRDLESKEDRGRSRSGGVIECSRRKEDQGRSRSGVVIECNRSNSRIVDLGGLRNEGVNSMSSLERGNTEKIEKKSEAAAEVDVTGIERFSKILIRVPGKNNKQGENSQEEPMNVEHKEEDDEDNGLVQEEGKIDTNKNSVDEEGKTWNLRPRKPLCKSLMTGGAVKNKGLAIAVPEKSKTQSPLRNMNNKPGENGGIGSGDVGEKKEKRKLTVNIALTKREIEEDIFSWTGSKPARRPKKRAKTVQKQLDFLFPGLWLVSVTPDSYKVSENSMKG